MKKIILIGNPNTGKTTLLNTITKSAEHVGNWHGVTVDFIEKKFKFENEEYMLVDLPGLYSLEAYSMEEKISIDYLKNNPDALVVNICDANNLEKNMLLTMQLLSINARVVLAVNMAKENKNVDYKKLEELLNIQVVPIDARNKKSVKTLLGVISKIFNQNDGEQCKELNINSAFNNTLTPENIYRKINQIMKKVSKFEKKEARLSLIDKVVLNKFLFLPIFVCVIAVVFYITFGPVGSFLSNAIASLFDTISEKVLSSLQHFSDGYNWVYYFLSGAIFGGVSSVLEFLPQVGLLFFFLSLLEDIGYLPRVAFMFDNNLKKIGLTGRSLFSLLMGFGCTATAVLTTRNMDNIKLKKRTAFLLPFMSCSAKLPIFLVFASAFFMRAKVLVLVGLYLFSILVGILVAFLSSKLFKDSNQEYFILELPKYRLPKFSKLMKDVWVSVKHFVVKVGTIILLSSSIIWILENFSTSLKFLEEGEQSENLLSAIAGWIYPIFKPLGFSSSLVVVVLIAGLIGKEMVVSSIGILNSVNVTGLSIAESIALISSPVSFTFASAMSFLVFTLFYSPCISAFETTSKELGYKFAITSFIFQLVVAYLLSYIVYNLLSKNIAVIVICLLIVLALVAFIMIKYRKQNKCGGNCNGCNRLCRR